jgi:hypothetical protein
LVIIESFKKNIHIPNGRLWLLEATEKGYFWLSSVHFLVFLSTPHPLPKVGCLPLIFGGSISRKNDITDCEKIFCFMLFLFF